jgi:phosphate-selective porin
MIKTVYINSTIQGLHPSFKSLVFAKKCGTPQWPIAQNKFRIRILGEFETEFEKYRNKTGAQIGSIDENSQRRKISRYCPFNEY